MKDILDLHTHTIVSGHAYNSLYEMVRSAADKGLTLYGCSDHTPAMPGGPDAMYFVNFKVIPREIYGVKVLMGAELNLLKPDGSVDLKEKMLEKLDYAIASLHLPCTKPGTMEENTSAYLHVMENPWVQIIGHPDDGRYPVDYKALVAAAYRLCGSKGSYVYGTRPQNAEGQANLLPDITKLCTHTGWEPKTPFAEGIYETLYSLPEADSGKTHI